MTATFYGFYYHYTLPTQNKKAAISSQDDRALICYIILPPYMVAATQMHSKITSFLIQTILSAPEFNRICLSACGLYRR
jgi:hypothetical protein